MVLVTSRNDTVRVSFSVFTRIVFISTVIFMLRVIKGVAGYGYSRKKRTKAPVGMEKVKVR